ncbi:MAG: DNA repair protein RecO [Gammaproteobacteria bacterium]|nr:MAG: DNA repair protein RecO [Gammaproteobacteria bacterium]
MRVVLAAAYLLHTRPYRNTSLLLEAFSREHGRLGLVARGVCRPGHRWRPLLQPFRLLRLSWQGRGDLGTLSAAEPEGPAKPPAGPLLIAGFYLNELLYRLLHRHDPHPPLFDAYHDSLRALAAGAPVEPCLRRFEWILLRESGYGLELRVDAQGSPIDPDRRYRYDPERGAVPDPQGVAAGATLLALAAGRFDEPAFWPEMKRLLGGVLRHHLGGRPLHSRRLWRR